MPVFFSAQYHFHLIFLTTNICQVIVGKHLFDSSTQTTALHSQAIKWVHDCRETDSKKLLQFFCGIYDLP